MISWLLLGSMMVSRQAPYSLQHVHCAHCEPVCIEPNCIKKDELRRKCPSAMRRDDLKSYTSKYHVGKSVKAVEDRHKLMRDFFSSRSNCDSTLQDNQDSSSRHVSHGHDSSECSRPPTEYNVSCEVAVEEPTPIPPEHDTSTVSCLERKS